MTARPDLEPAAPRAVDPDPTLDRPPPGETVILVAALAAATAGVLHLLAIPGHWGVSTAMTAFFAVVGGAQLALAAALRWLLPAWLLVVVIVGHLGVIGIYVASRTIDLPFVPAHTSEQLPVPRGVGSGMPIHDGDRVEPVGALDLTCLGAELLLVVCLTALLPARMRVVVTDLMVVVAVVTVVARLALLP